MSNSTNFRVSTPHPPVQSVLPLFEVLLDDPFDVLLDVTELGGVECSDAAAQTLHIKSVRSPDPLKQARRVANALRRGEIAVGARQAAVNSLCQYLIDSLQSPSSRIPH